MVNCGMGEASPFWGLMDFYIFMRINQLQPLFSLMLCRNFSQCRSFQTAFSVLWHNSIRLFDLNWSTHIIGASLVAQRIKHLPAMQETWVQSLGWEDPLEKEIATHSSILAWRIHGQGSLEGYSPCMESQRVRHNWVTFTSLTLLCWRVFFVQYLDKT